jgi:hypothetical protein
MKEIIKYQCEVCGRVYDDKEDAARCETKPVQNDKGVKVGDGVLITRGDGAGKFAKVTAITVQERGWGPANYDHSVALVADVIGSWGSRLLTFDSYEVVK